MKKSTPGVKTPKKTKVKKEKAKICETHLFADERAKLIKKSGKGRIGDALLVAVNHYLDCGSVEAEKRVQKKLAEKMGCTKGNCSCHSTGEKKRDSKSAKHEWR